MLNVVMLGPFSLRDGAGRDCTPRPHKLRTMLALLMVNAGQVVSAEQLTRELWPAETPRTAATATHVYVSRLRRHLQAWAGNRDRAGYVQTVPSGYQFNPPTHQLDLSLFSDLTNQAQEAEQAGDVVSASALLGRALDLWSGEALADVRTGARLRNVARRLDEARLAVCEHRIRLDLYLDRHQELVGELYGLVEQYPHWENFHSYLMIALYRARRTTEALTAYTRLRGWLVDNAGMEPSAEIQHLHQLMLSRDEELDGYIDVREQPSDGLFNRMVHPNHIPLPRLPEKL